MPPLNLDVTVRKKGWLERSDLLIGLLPFFVLFSLVAIVIRFARGEIFEGVYSSVPVIAVLMFYWQRSKATARNDLGRIKPRTKLFVLITIGAVLYFGISDYLRRVDTVDIAGSFEPGGYRNRYFGFLLPFTAEWQNVTPEGQSRLAAKEGTSANGAVLLQLGLVPQEDPDAVASVTIAVERIPLLRRSTTKAKYLDQLLAVLRSRPDAPIEIKHEPQIVIAGETYDRVSMIRPRSDRDYRVTMWVTVKREYGLIVSGNYYSNDGLAAVERLLNRMSQLPNR